MTFFISMEGVIHKKNYLKDLAIYSIRSIMTIEWLIELARWYIFFLEELLDSLQ